MSDFEGMQGKNDYSITVYLGGEKRLFTLYVHSITYYSYWLKTKGINWDYLLVYVRRTRKILCYYKYGDSLDRFPNFKERGRTKSGW